MRFRCNICGQLPAKYEFDADKPECPQCGATGSPYIVQLVDVHFLAPDPAGPIATARGRFKVACETKRDALARYIGDTYAASGEPTAVTCRSCKGTPVFKELAKLFGMELPEIAKKVVSAAPGKGEGCCG